MRLPSFVSVMLLVSSLATPAFAQSTLIPVVNRRSHVHDPVRNVLYITTTSGAVERFDLTSGQLLTPWQVGLSLNGCDITPDGAFLYCCDGGASVGQGFVRKVNLGTGQVTSLPYALVSLESGSFDIQIASNGRAFFTTRFNGSGWNPLREIVLATDAINIRTDAPGSGFGGQVRQDTHIDRGANRSRLLFRESNISSGPIFTYSAATNTFPSQLNTQTFNDSLISAVNRTGTQLALEVGSTVSVLAPALTTITQIVNVDGGHVFDAVRDSLYAVRSSTDLLLSFDMVTFQQNGSFTIGENVGASTPQGAGEMSVSANGAYAFLSTNSGVRVFTIGVPPPVVDSIVPAVGDYAQTTAVTIHGKFFEPSVTGVSFGGVAATNVLAVDAQTLTCDVPPGAPGPKSVAVTTATGTGTAVNGFRHAPALLTKSVVALGGSIDIALDVLPGSQIVQWLGAPTTGSIALPPFGGEYCLSNPFTLFVIPSWPIGNLAYSLAVPNDPILSGLSVSFQALAGLDLGNKKGAFTNCATLTFQ